MSCPSGGVGLALLVVLIYHQVSRKKDMKERQRLKEEEEQGSPVANHVNHPNVRERTRDFFFQANSNEPWNKEAMMFGGRTDRHNGPFRLRTDDNGGCFQCPHCKADGQISNLMKRDNWMNGGVRVEEDQERRRARMATDEERRRQAAQQQNLNRDVPKFYSHNNTNSFPPPMKESTEPWPSHRTDRNMDRHRSDMELKSRGHEMLHCKNCRRTYRSPEQNGIQDTITSKDPTALNGRGRNSPFEQRKHADFKREMRNVKFDLQSLRSSHGKESQEEAANPRDKEKENERRHKAQSGHALKVKLNLNPLRKSKIHPGRKNEQSHAENRSSKRRKEKRRHGKEKEEVEEEGKYDKKTKSSSETRRKSSKRGVVLKDGEKEEEEEAKGEEGQKSSTSSKPKTTISKSEKVGQESSEGDQVKNTNLESSQFADDTSASVSLQVHQYQAGGSVPSRAQLLSQNPFSLFPADRNRTTSLSLLGSAGSQLTGSSLSLQTGNVFLNTLAPGSRSLLPAGLANPTSPTVGLTGFSAASKGSSDSLSRPAAGGIISSVPSLLANPVLGSSVHSAPRQTLQSEEPVQTLVNPGADPALLSLSQFPLDSSGLVTSLKLDPGLGQGFQTGEGLLQLPTKSQVRPNQDRIPNQGQIVMSGVAAQAPGPETRVEMSSINSQAESRHVPVDTSPGAVLETEGAAVGGSRDSLKVSALDVSAPDVSTLSETSPGAGAAALLQQEYLSEDGSSSPRRRLRLILPEKTSNHQPTALERKIR